MSTVLVTGSDGFIGTRLVTLLAREGHAVIGMSRRSSGHSPLATRIVADVAEFDDWSQVLRGVDCVVHLAGRAHVVAETDRDPLASFRRVNVEGTRRLGEAAARNHVRRLVFLSSIGVTGSATCGQPFTEEDAPAPVEPYAVSKWEAEQCLLRICAHGAPELVIIRPPLVYGPGVKGNLLRLLRLIATGVPLPFASVRNRRSFVGLDNLCGLLMSCAFDPVAAGQLFLAADDETISTPELLRLMARSMERQPRLWPCPPLLLTGMAALAGKADEVRRLCGSLEVDSAKARSLLRWRSSVPLATGVNEMVHSFVRSRQP